RERSRSRLSSLSLHDALPILRLDFGSSLATGTPVTAYLAERILNTLVLLVCVEAVAVPVAVLVGVWSARRPRGLADHAVSLVTLDRKSTRLNSSHVSISYAVV